MFFLPCAKCGRRGRVCSLIVMRFKSHCDHCGHAAACHEARRWCASCIILMATAALLAGSLALFGNLGLARTAPRMPRLDRRSVRARLNLALEVSAGGNGFRGRFLSRTR